MFIPLEYQDQDSSSRATLECMSLSSDCRSVMLIRTQRVHSPRIPPDVHLTFYFSPGLPLPFSSPCFSPHVCILCEQGRPGTEANIIPLIVFLVCTTAGRPQELAWSTFRESMDWVILSKSSITSPHMLLHELREGTRKHSFKSIIGNVPSIKALLLINATNSLQVDGTFLPEDKYPSVPVFVVMKRVGAALSELVDTNPSTTEVKFELKVSGTMDEFGEQEMVCRTPGREFIHFI